VGGRPGRVQRGEKEKTERKDNKRTKPIRPGVPRQGRQNLARASKKRTPKNLHNKKLHGFKREEGDGGRKKKAGFAKKRPWRVKKVQAVGQGSFCLCFGGPKSTGFLGRKKNTPAPRLPLTIATQRSGTSLRRGIKKKSFPFR